MGWALHKQEFRQLWNLEFGVEGFNLLMGNQGLGKEGNDTGLKTCLLSEAFRTQNGIISVTILIGLPLHSCVEPYHTLVVELVDN